jgi:hypothetical protein
VAERLRSTHFPVALIVDDAPYESVVAVLDAHKKIGIDEGLRADRERAHCSASAAGRALRGPINLTYYTYDNYSYHDLPVFYFL